MNRERIKENTKKEIDQLFDSIENLEKKAERVSGEASRQVESKIQDLKTEKRRLSAYFTEMKESSEENWENAKSSLEKSMNSFQEGINELKSFVTS